MAAKQLSSCALTPPIAVELQLHHLNKLRNAILCPDSPRVEESPAGQRRLLFKGWGQASAALRKQEVKAAVQRKDVARPALLDGTDIKPGEEVHFTSGLSCSVCPHGYVTWQRADLSS